MKTVAIIGGGASGMLAAITAAEDGNNRVLLFERQQRVGKKLSATGNGRCNLTNLSGLEGRYHGAEPEFIRPAMEAFPPEEAVRFFRELGLLTVTEYGGRVYPLSDSANSAVDILRFACDSRGVETFTSAEITGLVRRNGGFLLSSGAGETEADAVIVACGGAAGAKLGGSGSGYELLKSLGHTRTPIYPALVQVTTTPDYPRALKGVRADARLTLTVAGQTRAESRGELQFTEKGVSGPVAFDISPVVSRSGDAEKELTADLLADYSREQVLALLRKKREQYPALPAESCFAGMLHNRLGTMLVKYSGTDRTKPLAEVTEEELRRLASAAKCFRLPVKGTEGFDNAQVTAGGIRTAEFDPRTMMSRKVPGLYACGEVLDVDGDCGGFNLQWAWASGRLAGRLGR